MIADYAFACHGPPPPSTPWPIVLAIVKRTHRHNARALLRNVVGTALGAGQLFGDKDGQIQASIAGIEAEAFPGLQKVPVLALKQSSD